MQGDARSYRKVLALKDLPSREAIETTAPALTNRRSDINRVVAQCGTKSQLESLQVFPATITKKRLDTLRRADAIVRDFCLTTGFEDKSGNSPSCSSRSVQTQPVSPSSSARSTPSTA